MITLYDDQGGEHPVDLAAETIPPGIVFIDLCQAQPAELDYVERATRIHLPSAHRLSEVESSSRLAMQGEALVINSPVVYRNEDATVQNTPVGFVLQAALLVTIRFVQLKAFSDFLAQRPFRIRDRTQANIEIFLGLLEVTVDRMADAMEQVGADLDTMSQRIFEPDREGRVSSKPVRVERRLANTLKSIGRNGDLTSHARNSLLGLGRLVAYVFTHAGDRLSADAKIRLDTLRQDIASLNEFETRLTDKVQFLLDSTLGFINIEQNRTFKILTVASVIGIPPTFVVGLYGMNFKSMPEYDWTYGYQFGLALIVLSMVVPTVMLKVRGWF